VDKEHIIEVVDRSIPWMPRVEVSQAVSQMCVLQAVQQAVLQAVLQLVLLHTD